MVGWGGGVGGEDRERESGVGVGLCGASGDLESDASGDSHVDFIERQGEKGHAVVGLDNWILPGFAVYFAFSCYGTIGLSLSD